MYSQQMLLPLSLRQRTSQDFMHDAPNQEAWDFLCRYPNWPNIHTLIIGPKSCGKSLLAETLAHDHHIPLLGQSDQALPMISDLPHSDIIVDNADVCDQTWLFHLINHQNLNQQRIIALTRHPLSAWNFAFLDLSSRMKIFYPIEIFDVNDALLFDLLSSGLKKRGIIMHTADQQGVIDYLMRRIPRTYACVQHVLDHLDTFLLEHQKKLTLPQVVRFFEVYQQNDPM